MHGMLSFLLFAGALHADFTAMKSQRLAIGLMAVLGTLISTVVVGTAMWFLLGLMQINLPFIWALVFGALISPTDPVAVLGLFKTVKVPDMLQAKMTGESLFNDGIGVVVFSPETALVTELGPAWLRTGPLLFTIRRRRLRGRPRCLQRPCVFRLKRQIRLDQLRLIQTFKISTTHPYRESRSRPRRKGVGNYLFRNLDNATILNYIVDSKFLRLTV
jgi:hypothetical protein